MSCGDRLKDETDPRSGKLRINASGCPNACGQHWVGDIGFYGNARKIEGREVPYYLMLLGGSYEQFGVAIQSLPGAVGSGGGGAGAGAFQSEPEGRRVVPGLCAAVQSAKRSGN